MEVITVVSCACGLMVRLILSIRFLPLMRRRSLMSLEIP